MKRSTGIPPEEVNTQTIQEQNSSDIDNYDELIKIIIVGDPAVGKTSIIKTYVEGVCPLSHYPTPGIDLYVKTIQVDDRIFRLNIWDATGAESFRSTVMCYYRSADIALIVFDTLNPMSLTNIEKWLFDALSQGAKDVPYMIVGNKCENKEKVAKNIRCEMLKDINIRFNKTAYLVSSLENFGIDNIFEDIVEQFAKNPATGLCVSQSPLLPSQIATKRYCSFCSII